MTSANHVEYLNQGRGWLNRAAEMLDSCEDHRSDAEFARAAAAIGNGFIALAHAERAAATSATLDAAAERVRRAADEARPHDGEPEMTLGEALRHPLGHPVPNAEQPRGEAAYLLEGDDEVFTAEPKHAVAEGVVWVASGQGGPIHAAVSQAIANAWASDNFDTYGPLALTALEVDRG